MRQWMPSRRDWLFLLAGIVIALGIMKIIDIIKVPLKPESSAVTISWLPDTVKRWEDPINDMAKKYNIDPNLVAIIVTLESGGYDKAESGAKARGLMQITSPTAKDIAARYLKEPRKDYDLKDPRTNIEFGTAYLALLRDEFGSSKQAPSWNSTVELIAAAYNGGPGAANSVEQGRGLRDTQTVIYSRDAFNMWRERHANKSPTFDRWKERGGWRLIDMAKGKKPT